MTDYPENYDDSSTLPPVTPDTSLPVGPPGPPGPPGATGPQGPVGPQGQRGVAGLNTGAAGGDLTGFYPNPSVVKVDGVTITGTPTTGQVITATSPTTAVWFSSGGAVIFDGGTTSKNLRSDRPLNQSPIDNTQDGIINLGSDTSGLTTGVTASYSTVSGGDQNVISDVLGVIGGGRHNTIAAGSPFSVISGGVSNSIATNSQGAVIGGGFTNSVSGFAAAVLAGDSNQATAYGAVVIGGEVTIASRAFQEAFGAGGNGAQRGTYYVGKQSNNAVPGICGDNLGGQFTLDNDHSYIIDVTALATKLSTPRGTYGAFKAKVLAHCTSGGIAVIDQYILDPANASLLNGTSFAFGITVSGTNNILIANFTGLTSTIVNCQYRFDWIELA
jgi:hypothetical protein